MSKLSFMKNLFGTSTSTQKGQERNSHVSAPPIVVEKLEAASFGPSTVKVAQITNLPFTCMEVRGQTYIVPSLLVEKAFEHLQISGQSLGEFESNSDTIARLTTILSASNSSIEGAEVLKSVAGVYEDSFRYISALNNSGGMIKIRIPLTESLMREVLLAQGKLIKDFQIVDKSFIDVQLQQEKIQYTQVAAVGSSLFEFAKLVLEGGSNPGFVLTAKIAGVSTELEAELIKGVALELSNIAKLDFARGLLGDIFSQFYEISGRNIVLQKYSRGMDRSIKDRVIAQLSDSMCKIDQEGEIKIPENIAMKMLADFGGLEKGYPSINLGLLVAKVNPDVTSIEESPKKSSFLSRLKWRKEEVIDIKKELASQKEERTGSDLYLSYGKCMPILTGDNRGLYFVFGDMGATGKGNLPVIDGLIISADSDEFLKYVPKAIEIKPNLTQISDFIEIIGLLSDTSPPIKRREMVHSNWVDKGVEPNLNLTSHPAYRKALTLLIADHPVSFRHDNIYEFDYLRERSSHSGSCG